MNETDGGGEVKAIKDGDGDKDTSEKEGDKEKPGACDDILHKRDGRQVETMCVRRNVCSHCYVWRVQQVCTAAFSGAVRR